MTKRGRLYRKIVRAYKRKNKGKSLCPHYREKKFQCPCECSEEEKNNAVWFYDHTPHMEVTIDIAIVRYRIRYAGWCSPFKDWRRQGKGFIGTRSR